MKAIICDRCHAQLAEGPFFVCMLVEAEVRQLESDVSRHRDSCRAPHVNVDLCPTCHDFVKTYVEEGPVNR